MVCRKMLYFHRMPSRLHQDMDTAGAANIYHVIEMKNVILALFIYPITAYQGHFIVLVQ